MHIYILTSSAAYYPQSGTSDWEGVYTDYDNAMRAYRDLLLDYSSSFSKTLISISLDGSYRTLLSDRYEED